MHMADALISPAVGGTMWAATAGLIGYCSKKIKSESDDRKIPLMGVVGAFIFAAQMINFTIPGTGSSGHLGGGMILAILLGPYAAFLTMSSVLTVQALFFADGGLLSLGCNIFNLGFFPCFVAYPFVYKQFVNRENTQAGIVTGSIIASIIGLQLGALCVVLETFMSGISELPFNTFVLLMQPIHLAIGIVEGLVTASVVVFVWKSRPEVLNAAQNNSIGNLSLRNILTGLVVISLLTAGVLSWFASNNPDGLEWAMFKTSGKEELEKPSSGIYSSLQNIQNKTAFLPDYGFKNNEADLKPDSTDLKSDSTNLKPDSTNLKSDSTNLKSDSTESHESWPAINAGTSLSGLIGGLLTLLLAVTIGFALKKRKISNQSTSKE